MLLLFILLVAVLHVLLLLLSCVFASGVVSFSCVDVIVPILSAIAASVAVVRLQCNFNSPLIFQAHANPRPLRASRRRRQPGRPRRGREHPPPHGLPALLWSRHIQIRLQRERRAAAHGPAQGGRGGRSGAGGGGQQAADAAQSHGHPRGDGGQDGGRAATAAAGGGSAYVMKSQQCGGESLSDLARLLGMGRAFVKSNTSMKMIRKFEKRSPVETIFSGGNVVEYHNAKETPRNRWRLGTKRNTRNGQANVLLLLNESVLEIRSLSLSCSPKTHPKTQCIHRRPNFFFSRTDCFVIPQKFGLLTLDKKLLFCLPLSCHLSCPTANSEELIIELVATKRKNQEAIGSNLSVLPHVPQKQTCNIPSSLFFSRLDHTSLSTTAAADPRCLHNFGPKQCTTTITTEKPINLTVTPLVVK